mgnify:CR=1 FL=1
MLLIADFYQEESEPKERENRDLFLETIASLSHLLLSELQNHYAVWADIPAGDIQTMWVSDETEQLLMLTALMQVKTFAKTINYESLYRENFEYEAIGEVFRVDVKGDIHQEEKQQSEY